MRNGTILIISFWLLALCPVSINSQSNDIFSQDVIVIELDLPEPAWHDTLVARKKRLDKTPLLATAKVEDRTYTEVEVRYKGNSSFHSTLKHGGDKFPFRIKAKKGEKFNDVYKELRLSNNFRDPSAVRELLAYKIASTYIPTPRVSPGAVTINGEYVGVFTITEGISDRMIKEFYCDDDGVLVKCDPQFELSQPGNCPKGEFSNLKFLGENPDCYKPLYDISNGKESKAIMDLARNLAKNDDPDSYINVHEALWMHALNNVMVNLDSYLGIFCHNYFVYRDKYDQYHPLIWDLNLSFGGFATLDQKINPDPYKLSPIIHDRYLSGRRPLIESLLKDRINQLTYFYMITTIVNDWFESEAYLEDAMAMQAIIRPYRAKEANPLYPMSDFDKSLTETVKRGDNRSIPGIAQLMETRKDYLLNHKLLDRQSPRVTEWTRENHDNGVAITIKTASQITEAYLYYQEEECGKWQKSTMHKLSNVAFQSDVHPVYQFYVLVGTEAGAALSPSSAPGTLYTIE